ncbi:MAG TPA: hypothetical protein DIT19_02455 [Desulfonauticus sp.]|nr:MAG: Rubrerythrin [Desulfonauticus sp. 38_4375]HCO12072.1 hypothetical protein [Desulfonauticus sp.]
MQELQKWFCKALEMEERGYNFYASMLEKCNDPYTREVFTLLRDEELKHIKRIKEIVAKLEKGIEVEVVCRECPFEPTPNEVFQNLVKKYKDKKSVCAQKLEALDMGIEFELNLVDFYSQKLQEAQSAVVKEFLTKMVQEEKMHYILLSDLSYYYEDPEGWAMGKGGFSLDGA